MPKLLLLAAGVAALLATATMLPPLAQATASMVPPASIEVAKTSLIEQAGMACTHRRVCRQGAGCAWRKICKRW
jgi:hypothetical protein